MVTCGESIGPLALGQLVIIYQHSMQNVEQQLIKGIQLKCLLYNNPGTFEASTCVWFISKIKEAVHFLHIHILLSIFV